MNRSKRRVRVNALTRELGAGHSEGSREAWAVQVRKRPPLLFAQRRRHVVVRTSDELILVRPRRRRPFEREDVVARIPYDCATMRRRMLGPLRQLVVTAEPDGPADESTYALEFRLRDRHFVNGLAQTIAASTRHG